MILFQMVDDDTGRTIATSMTDGEPVDEQLIDQFVADTIRLRRNLGKGDAER